VRTDKVVNHCILLHHLPWLYHVFAGTHLRDFASHRLQIWKFSTTLILPAIVGFIYISMRACCTSRRISNRHAARRSIIFTEQGHLRSMPTAPRITLSKE